MKRAIAWFAENHVAANLLMALLVTTGLLTIPTLRQEMIPEISLDVVTVDVRRKLSQNSIVARSSRA